jgi:hypothetical protein
VRLGGGRDGFLSLGLAYEIWGVEILRGVQSAIEKKVLMHDSENLRSYFNISCLRGWRIGGRCLRSPARMLVEVAKALAPIRSKVAQRPWKR